MNSWKEEHRKGYFWIANKFIDIYAKDLSIYAQIIYLCMCRYAGKKENSNNETFVGCRRIGNDLKINKNTVSDHRKELEAYGLIRRLKNKNGKATHYRVYTDPYDVTKPYDPAIHKEFKENKEVKNEKFVKEPRYNKEVIPELEKLREKWGKK